MKLHELILTPDMGHLNLQRLSTGKELAMGCQLWSA